MTFEISKKLAKCDDTNDGNAAVKIYEDLICVGLSYEYVKGQ